MTAYGSCGWALVLVSLGVCCSGRYTDSWPIRLGIAAAIVAATFSVQIDQVPLIGFVAAVQGEPSVAMLLISGGCAARSILPERVTREDLSQLCACIFWLGLVMYPSALGVGPIDLYAVGYHPYAALGLLFLALLCVGFAATRLLAVWATLALLLHGHDAGESDNILDYLIDPIVLVYSWWHVGTRAWRRFRDARR